MENLPDTIRSVEIRLPPQQNSLDSRQSHHPKIGKIRWTICAILFAATSINYVDRQVLGILAPLLQRDIGWTDLQYGYIIGGFQLAYAIGLVLAGRMVDKLGTRISYAIIMGVWSLSAMSHALARSVLAFAVARFFLGLGEAGNFPAAVKATAEWFPQRERSLATGIFISGASVGAILAPAVVPWVTLHFGWQAAFLMTGIFSMAWIVIWLLYYRVPTEQRFLTHEELIYIQQDPSAPSQVASWKQLICHRQTWAFAIGKFMTDPIWWFYLYWLPLFLTRRFHLGLDQLALPLIVIYNVSTVGSVGGGWLPSFLNRGGMRIGRARMVTMLLCACLVTPIFCASRVSSEWAAIMIISLAVAAHQGWSANLLTIVSDMFPRADVGTVVGIGGTAGSIGGVLFSLGTGLILSHTHNYTILFILSASAYLVSLAAMHVLAPGMKPAALGLDNR